MRTLFLLFPLILPSLLCGSVSSDLQVGLQALQQIRTLIPERLSVEEFSILVDQSCINVCSEASLGEAPEGQLLVGMGPTRRYYSRWTLAGDPIRLLDQYLEFEYTSFWRYPTAMEKLQIMERPKQGAHRSADKRILENGGEVEETAMHPPSSDSKRGQGAQGQCGARFGEVRYQGNQFSSPEYLRHFVTKQGADPVSLVQDMARMNQNPFRRTDAVWKEGGKPGSVDLELKTIDRLPYRFYMGADNTGTMATDRDRLFFGLNLGKTIVDDSEFSYQFTCAPNWNRFLAQTALCRVPFPARQTFIFYGGYSQVEPKLSDHYREKSVSWQVDGRYRIPILINTLFLQEILLGYDFKEVIGRIRNDGKKVFYGVADINQFMVGYDFGLTSGSIDFSLEAELYFNPGSFTTHNKTKDYQPFRAHSGPGYAYGKLANSLAYSFHDWKVSYDLNMQASSKNLLPSEQFNLAGYYAVRGFEERIVNTDNALLINLTLQAPRLSIGQLTGLSRMAFDELYFYAFFDYGLGGNHRIGPGENRTQELASIGPGMRYQIDRYVVAHFDYGFQLFHDGFDNPTNSRYNFGLIVSF